MRLKQLQHAESVVRVCAKIVLHIVDTLAFALSAEDKNSSWNEVEYDKETKPFEVTTRTDVKEITPGFETIQNATWINTNLKLNGSSGNDGVWIVADGSYPTLAFAQ